MLCVFQRLRHEFVKSDSCFSFLHTSAATTGHWRQVGRRAQNEPRSGTMTVGSSQLLANKRMLVCLWSPISFTFHFSSCLAFSKPYWTPFSSGSVKSTTLIQEGICQISCKLSQTSAQLKTFEHYKWIQTLRHCRAFMVNLCSSCCNDFAEDDKILKSNH